MLKKDDIESKRIMTVGFKSIQDSFQTKEENGNEYGYFEGYGSTFNNVDRGKDMVVEGAFLKSINDGATVQILWQHDRKEVLGSYVKLKEDKTGLYVKGRLNLAVGRAKEAYALLKAGDIDSMSIGYFLRAYEIIKDESGNTEFWKLTELELSEISLVSEPMNVEATITDVKSKLEQNNNNPNKEEGVDMGQPKGNENTKEISGIEVAQMVTDHKSAMDALKVEHTKSIDVLVGEKEALDTRVKTLETEAGEKDATISTLEKDAKDHKDEKELAKEKDAFAKEYPNFTGEKLESNFKSFLEVKGLENASITLAESFKKENLSLSSGNPLFKAAGAQGDSVGDEMTDEKFDSAIEVYKKENGCSHTVATEAIARQLKKGGK